MARISLKKNTIANFIGQGCISLFAIVFVPVYVHHLGVEAYGLIGFYTALQVWFTILDLGMTPTVAREMARYTPGANNAQSLINLVRSMEVIVYTIAILIALILWIFSSSIASHWVQAQNLSPNIVTHAVTAMAFLVGIRFCEGIYRGILYGLERQVLFNGIFASLNMMRYVGATVVVMIWPSIIHFFEWQIFMSAVTIVCLGLAAHAALPQAQRRAQFSWKSLKNVRGFASGMSLASLFALLFYQVDKITLSHAVSLENFGYYMLAIAISNVFTMLTFPVGLAFFPRFSALAAKGDSAAEQSLFHMGVQLVAMLTAPALTLCLFLAEPLLYAWTGNRALALHVAPILHYLAIGAFLTGSLVVSNQIQIAHGWTGLQTQANLLGVALLTVLIFIGVHLAGLQGAAMAFAFSYACVWIYTITRMHKKLLKDDLWFYLRSSLLLPLMASGAVVVLLVQSFHFENYDRLINGLLFTIAGALAMLASALVLPLGRSTLKQLIRIIIKG